MSDAFSFRRARAILIKEFMQLRRDRVTLRMIVMIPIMQLLLFGYALNTDPKHLPTAVISQDNSAIARAIVAGLKNTDYFSIDYDAKSESEAQTLMQSGKILYILNIPANFERDLVRGDHPKMLLEADGSDPVAISGGLAAANGMLDTVLQQELKGTLSNLKTTTTPLEIEVHRLYNPEGFTRYNVVPGLIAIVLTMTGIMMTALSITRERERSTMENLLAMPVHPFEVMVGKIAPYVIIGFIQSSIIVVLAKFLFGVPIIGDLSLLAAALLVFITCNMAIGFTLSAAAQNQTQAIQMSMMITLPSILLSGYLFPFLGMPKWAQVIGYIMPATHFMAISREIMLKGSGFNEIWPHLWPMLVFMLAITYIAMKRYRRTLD